MMSMAAVRCGMLLGIKRLILSSMEGSPPKHYEKNSQLGRERVIAGVLKLEPPVERSLA
jgi:hypothetical protein